MKIRDRMITGNDVHDLRVALGLTQKELGHCLSVTDVTVGKWEKRGRKPALMSGKPLLLWYALEDYVFGRDQEPVLVGDLARELANMSPALAILPSLSYLYTTLRGDKP